MRHLMIAAALSLSSALVPVVAYAQDTLLPVVAGEQDGKIMLTLPKPGADGIAARYIYIAQVETGLGSAAVGVDRGAWLQNGVIRFRRVGGKVVAEMENQTFVAPNGSAAEQAAVANSFSNATLWIGEIAETRGDGSFSFDFASFLAMDHFGFARQLGSDANKYALDPKRSLADPGKVKVFARNAEFSALLSFSSERPSAELRNVSPTGPDVAMWVRHSLIALPTEPFPIRTDPYGFVFSNFKYDYSAPLAAPMLQKMALRHRLEKIDPSDPTSPVKEPIIFYIDPAAPEPVRQALADGVGWWSDAFDAAGLPGAFRVEILPEGADPLDIRYNVVNWVNRATRGWSYGGMMVDPRTGEVLKGSVMLGSLRVRQDILIFQALVGAGLSETGDPNDPVATALARIRQLGAHEVGHALGFSHNFAGSSQGRYSVMDYPAPRVKLTDGKLDLTDAYGTGIGEWDKFVVRYLYGATTDEEARAMVAEARAQGLRFVGDGDARGFDTANPQGALWDDGGDPVAELARVMEVRKVALQRFNIDAIPGGQDMASLRRAFVPIWLLHRYQSEAAAKALGGVIAPVALAGDDAMVANVPAANQRAALDALIQALSVEALTVPARLQPILSFGPGSDGDYQTDIEVMPTAGGPVFDTLSATEIGAVHILDSLLDPQRLNRLDMQHAGDSGVPSAYDVVARLLAHAQSVAGQGAIGRRIATTIALDLARTARDGKLSRSIALQIDGQLDAWAKALSASKGKGADADWRRGLGALLSDEDALTRALADRNLLPSVPPGMPI
ncbi:zinc-dependent metalloprotease [Erythrobacter sp. SDW2]|uniref:zinc-dependent metalloprotease n=1 Tax=Erythrobacter sp. SDW2 TaxID=2907154 RepID=UPI001F42230A|nr:zinc-dependent metalloprotease [Erythrobacter sp. SDW2]UIP05833.1 zinc-dependent metalloprotease [Erythrobacter sp. SDW2]